MWAFLGAIAPLFLMIYKEWCSAEAKAKADNKAFTIDQANLKSIVDTAVNNWNLSNGEKTKEATNAWDAADLDASKGEDSSEK